tara:strand:+ start:14947 stop:15072 length:126 start_codon:yes stop_codon:yes gene_type:complete
MLEILLELKYGIENKYEPSIEIAKMTLITMKINNSWWLNFA